VPVGLFNPWATLAGSPRDNIVLWTQFLSAKYVPQREDHFYSVDHKDVAFFKHLLLQISKLDCIGPDIGS
jgi:hypothetical protein